MPTLAELANTKIPQQVTGISFMQHYLLKLYKRPYINWNSSLRKSKNHSSSH